MDEHLLLLARKSRTGNRSEIAKSEDCGCFHCLEILPSKSITEWVDGDKTALCPCCGIDAVIGSASGHRTDKPFLQKMREYWF
jgi:hypothetical protein